MRKSDLKTGMRVENRRGDIYMVLTDVYSEHYGNQKIAFVNYDMFSCGDNYKEDLTSALSGNSDIDIVKVYNICKDPTLLRTGMLNLNERHLIWERPKKKMTIAELESETQQETPTKMFQYYIAFETKNGKGACFTDSNLGVVDTKFLLELIEELGEQLGDTPIITNLIPLGEKKQVI